MKLGETDWKSVKFDDRTILPKDMKYFTAEQINALNNLEVVKIDKKDERYRVLHPKCDN